MKTFEQEKAEMLDRIEAVIEGRYEPIMENEINTLRGVVYLVKGTEKWYVGETKNSFSQRYSGIQANANIERKVGPIERAFIVAFPEDDRFIAGLEIFAIEKVQLEGLITANTTIKRSGKRYVEAPCERVSRTLHHIDGRVQHFDSIQQFTKQNGCANAGASKLMRGEQASCYGWYNPDMCSREDAEQRFNDNEAMRKHNVQKGYKAAHQARRKSIALRSPDGVVMEFESRAAAAVHIGVAGASVSSLIRGESKQTGGGWTIAQ